MTSRLAPLRSLRCGLIPLLAAFAGCGKPGAPPAPAVPGEPSKTATLGSFEVTARLEEIPEGAIFQKDLYNYTTILKYRILAVHRGDLKADTIHVGHYNPFKPRSEASDRSVKGIGGSVKRFRAGDTHRMALEAPLDDHYMGGIIDKYFGEERDETYWAVWTDNIP